MRCVPGGECRGDKLFTQFALARCRLRAGAVRITEDLDDRDRQQNVNTDHLRA